MKKRILSIVLSIVMLVGLLPTTVLAADPHSSHPVCGATCAHEDSHSTLDTWTAWNGEDAKPFAAGIQLEAGNYYLTGNLTISNTIRISGTVNLCLNGHTISNGTNSTYNVIEVSAGATLNICDCSEEEAGSIISNSANTFGEAIDNFHGTVNVYGGSIRATGNIGNGIYNDYGTVNVYGGSISAATGNLYFGIDNSHGTVNVHGGSISATDGSYYGIYNNGSATVSGGTVSGSNNGIHNSLDASLTVSGNADIIGGNYGISNYNGKLQLSGAPTINGETADIRLDSGNNSTPTIEIVGVLTNTEKYTVTTQQTPAADTPVVFTSTVDERNAAKFESANSDYQVLYADGVLKLAVKPAHTTHPICGKTCTHDTTHETITWTAWEPNTCLPSAAKNYYLTADVTISSRWEPANGTVLCLNGHTITMSGNNDVIKVGSDKTFTLTDCGATGTITHASGAAGRGASVYGGTFNMYGGSITGNSTDNNGGGVLQSTGTVNMYGGSITGNTAEYDGGGVHAEYGTFNMYDGSITCNSAGKDGGGANLENSSVKFNMSGGSITDNSAAEKGGGVYVHNGTFTVSGSPKIIDNTKGDADNNLHLSSGMRVTVGGVLSEEAQIGITIQASGGGTFTSDWSSHMSSVEDTDISKYFTSDSNGFTIQKGTNDLKLVSAVVSVTGVELNKESTTLTVGGTETLTATVVPDNATNKAVNWSSNNESVATVADGVVSAIGEGTATITVTTADGGKTDTCIVTVLAAHEHPICGDAECASHGSGVAYTAWDGTGTPSGNVYLTDNVTLTETLIISSGEVNLCLNGYSITRSDWHPTIRIKEGATLNLCDCNGSGQNNGSVTNNYDNCVVNEGALTVYGGTVEGPTWGITNSGTLTVYGGRVASTGERGIYNAEGTVYVYGGTVSGNSYGIYNEGGTANVTGGTVTATRSNGYGIYNRSNGTVTVSGGTVTATGSNGFGIYNHSDGASDVGTTTNVSGTANVSGSFLGIYNSGTLTVSGGTVKSTGTDGNNYGIYNYYHGAGSLELSGAPTITGATAGVYLDGGIITLGGELSYTQGNAISVLMETPGTFTTGWTDKMGENAENYGSYFTSKNEGYTVQPDGSGELKLAERPSSYTVTFNANGGSGTMANQTIEVGTETALSPTSFTRSGYKFSGWATSADGAKVYDDKQSVTDIAAAGESITLFAVWTEKATITISDVQQQYDYTGEPIEFNLNSPLADFTVKYRVKDTTTWSDSIPTEVNIYDVEITRAEDANYKKYEMTFFGKLVINKAVVNEPAIASKVYNGENQTAVVPSSELYTVESNDGGTNVGPYDVVLTLKDSLNYKWNTTDDASVTLPFVVTKADNAWITKPSIEGWTHGDVAKTPSYEAKFGTVTVEYKKASEEDSSYTTIVPTDAGNYKVKFTVEANTNFESLSKILDLTIAKAIPSYTTPSNVTATYGQTLADAELPEGWTWKDATLSVGNAGTNQFTAVFTPDDTANYKTVEKDVTITVAKKEVAEPVASGSYTYTGSEQTVTLSGVESFMTVSGNKATNAGNHVVTVTLDDNHKWNSSSDGKIAWSIAKADMSADITASGYNAVFDNQAHTISVNIPEGASIKYGITEGTYNLDVAPEYTNAGTYTVYYKVEKPNYNDVTGNADVVINEKDITNAEITLGEALTFNGNEQTQTIASATVDGLAITYNVSGNVNTNAGNYTLTITGNENFEGTAQKTYAIARKSVEGANVGSFNAMTYTGSAQTPVASVTIDGLTATGTWSNVTKVADTTTFTASGNFTGTIANQSTGMAKATQSAPETPAAVNETIKAKADGRITGVDDTMEYKKQGDANYIAITADTVENLAAGTYLVRYKETENYFASSDKQIVIADGVMLTIAFNSNEGTSVDSVTCEWNQTITAPTEPTKDGFEFISWYLDDTLTTKWTNEYQFTADTTLYAKWVQGTVSDHEDHVDEIEADGLNDVAKAEETDIQLVVQVEEATEGDSEQTAIKGIADAPNNFGFYDITLEKSSGGYVTNASSVIEIKLPYDFTRKTNIKVYRYHSGVSEELAQLDAIATAPYVDGKCYVDKSNNCIYIYSSKFSTYAVAYDTVRSSSGGGTTRYTVKFDINGGSSVSNATVTKNAKVAEPKTPEKDGYTFGGWYTDEALTEKYDFDSKVTKNLTLYAKWDKHDDEQPGTDTHNCPSLAFDDLDITKWYHFDTDYVIENGIFKGTTETTFEPDSAQTRAMMVTVLYRAEGEPVVNRSIPFADVDMGAYYANAVIWGQQNGIIKGYSETEFGPDDKITREQIAAIMHRYAQYKGIDVSVGENTNILSYDDFDSISEYAIASMQYACGSGLIKGKSESTLNPLDNATRAEIAAILHRFIEVNK